MTSEYLAYYNENDKFAAAWLRELIKVGLIANGEVDERSIVEVQPSDVQGFTQCHWFAGIGVWSYALRQAGWPDNGPQVWTGSCPCQPFSAAGKQEGFTDPRHLWPEWHRLIRECKPDTIFGEQVGNALGWFDLVSGDLEGEGYAIGSAIMGAHSVGAPHIRQRLYFVAESQRTGLSPQQIKRESREAETGDASARSGVSTMADTLQSGRWEIGRSPLVDEATYGGARRNPRQSNGDNVLAGDCEAGELGDAELHGLTAERKSGESQNQGRMRESQGSSGFASGFWADAEWLWCRDQKYRAVEGSTQSESKPLADGTSDDLGLVRLGRYPGHQDEKEEILIYAPLISEGKKRVGRLRGYGNAIVAPCAQAFIEAYLEVLSESS
jgi:DNA (cytosine-5)-methyltransferase 1